MISKIKLQTLLTHGSVHISKMSIIAEKKLEYY